MKSTALFHEALLKHVLKFCVPAPFPAHELVVFQESENEDLALEWVFERWALFRWELT